MKHAYYILGILVLMMISPYSSEAKESGEVSIVLDWTINTNHTGLYAAAEKGYFDQLNVSVEILSPPEMGALGLLKTGKADFAISFQEELTYAITQNVPVKAVAAILQHNTSGFASRKKEGITRPADFEGKTYGGWGMPIEHAIVDAIMEADGADFGKVRNVSIGSVDFLAATENTIDIVWVYEGWEVIAARQRGIPVNYIPMIEYEPALDYYTPLIASSEAFLEKNPETTKRFLEALTKGYTWAAENPEAAAEILLDAAPELDRELVENSQEFVSAEYIADAPAWGYMEKERFVAFTKWLVENELIDAPIDNDSAFTNKYLPEPQ